MPETEMIYSIGSGLGDRRQQIVDGVTTNYTLDLAAGLTQVLADGTNTYLYGNGRIAQAGNTTEYFLGDALGSVRQLADSVGAVTLTQSYAPYGETVSSVGSGTSVYQYTGEIRDTSGLTFLRARYYAPQDGRLISRDTWAGDYNRPLSLNRWNYVEGNPVNFTDPSGQICLDPWAPSGIHFDLNRGCDYPDGSIGGFWWRRDPLGNDTSIIDMPWVDEQAEEMWAQYPNSCGAAALFMFLRGEGVAVDFDSLVLQLSQERPGGYDGYCCSNGWNGTFPTPTPDPLNWCNEACTSAETLASVARMYGLDIVSGDNWTHENVFKKVESGHPVLVLIRSEVSSSQRYFGHFVVIRGFVDGGWTVVFNDSYPGEAYWDARGGSSEIRRQIGEGRTTSWDTFDASWASGVDPQDPLSSGGHIRWAMSVK